MSEGGYVAELNFATDITSVADLVRQASGQMEGSLASLFRYVEQLGASGGIASLGTQAQRAVAQVAELQVALAKLSAEKASTLGLGSILPASAKANLTNQTLLNTVQGGVSGATPRAGVGLPGGQALVPFDDGTVARINLANGKILESYGSQAEALAFLKAKAAELASTIETGTGVQTAATAASLEFTDALTLETAGLNKTEAAAARLLATQKALAAGLASGAFTRVGGAIETPAGLFNATSGTALNPLQAVNAQQKEAALRAAAAVKAAKLADEEARTPASKGIEEGLAAAKYVAAYAAVFELVKVIKVGIEETKAFQEGLLGLDIALESVGQQGAINIGKISGIAAAAGGSPGEGLTTAARGIQAFRSQSAVSQGAASTVGVQSTTAAFQAQVLAGGKLKDVQGQLIAGAREFDLGAEGQIRVLDAATNAQRTFGGSIGEVLGGLSQVAGLASEAGFSVEQLANAIGLITTSTNLTGASAAGDLKRILGGSGSPAFQKALVQVGVNTDQSTAGELTDLAAAYKNLNEAQKNQLVTTLGGRRSAEALIPLLQDGNLLLDANARSAEGAGAAEDEFNRRQQTLAGVLRQASGAAKVLITDLGQSGIGSGFGLALTAITPLLQVLDGAIKLFNDLPSPIREVGFAVLDLTLALKGLELVFGRSFALGGAGFLSKIAKAGTAVEGAAVETAAVTGAGGAAAAGARLGSAGIGEAEVGAAAAGSSLLALAGAAALLGVALFGVVEVAKAFKLAGNEGKVADALRVKGGGVDSLLAQSSKAASLASDIKDGSSGFTGSIANFLSGGGAKQAAGRLEAFSKDLNEQVDAINKAANKGHGEGIFGSEGPKSVSQLDAGIKQLAASGQTSAGVVNVLTKALDNLAGTAQKAAVFGVKGGVAVTGGKEAFSSGLFGNDSLIPESVLDRRRAQEALDRINAGLAPGVKRTSSADALSNKDFTGKFQDQLDPENAKKIREEIQRKVGDKPVLTPADQAEIAKIVADGYGLSDPKSIEALRQKIIEAFKVRSVADKAGTGRVAFLRNNPTLIGDIVTQLGTATQGASSEAQAAGGTTHDLTKVANDNLKAFQALATDVKSAGLAATPQLLQKIAEARVALYNAFAAQVAELATAAKDKLATGDSKGAAAIDKEAAQVLKLANESGANAGLLAGHFGNLGAAKTALTNAAINSAGKEVTAAAALLRQAALDAAALRAAAARLNAAAAAANATALASLSPVDQAAAERADHTAGRVGARADAAAAAAAAAAPGTPKAPLLNPGAAAGISSALAAANKAGAAAVGDTAAQIAAARNAANVFPGAKLEQAAAAIQTAAADLGAQKRGTVAYYNALGALRGAQYAYVQAVLDARHVAREASIDLTNPLTVAREALRTAQDKLATDRRKGAPADVIASDKLEVRQAANTAEQTAFQQNLSQVQVNAQLGRISQAAYLAYLNQQHDHLKAIAHKTYEQQQELNQVDAALQEAAKQLQGQFNLGAIRVPTVYEVRRAIGTQATANSANYQQTNNVTINGADFAKVVAFVKSVVGPTSAGRFATSTRKGS